MNSRKSILSKIKKTIHKTEPGATVILYGSFARGENRPDSDLDILILVDSENTDWKATRKITHPLYDIELETSQVISPVVISKKEWQYKYLNTPLYANVKQDGIVL